ncbi:MAG: hypothetical protein RID53_24830 [Coleofasciculus sp. B1-GNL1-01]
MVRAKLGEKSAIRPIRHAGAIALRQAVNSGCGESGGKTRVSEAIAK